MSPTQYRRCASHLFAFAILMTAACSKSDTEPASDGDSQAFSVLDYSLQDGASGRYVFRSKAGADPSCSGEVTAGQTYRVVVDGTEVWRYTKDHGETWWGKPQTLEQAFTGQDEITKSLAHRDIATVAYCAAALPIDNRGLIGDVVIKRVATAIHDHLAPDGIAAAHDFSKCGGATQTAMECLRCCVEESLNCAEDILDELSECSQACNGSDRCDPSEIGFYDVGAYACCALCTVQFAYGMAGCGMQEIACPEQCLGPIDY